MCLGDRKVGKEMVCNTCGRQITNESANFCEYCGASLRTNKNVFGGSYQDMTASGSGQTEQTPPYYGGQNWNNQTGERSETFQKSNWFSTNQKTNGEPVISFGKWLLLMLVLPMIPVIGPIIYLVVLFVTAFGKTQSVTLRNWARAMLVMLLVVFIMLATMAEQMAYLLNGIV